ncbi:MAG: ATP-binding cassette domain-containing protein, partial [Lachnospiraceae bacterium]|nr:ATP-binding cassette domain-containing protein [Lachnospiraceae bacterium]
MEKNTSPVLEIRHMNISFLQYEKGFRQVELPVISDLNLTIEEGEMVAVVGSSGSGKSLLAHGVMGILPYNASMGGEMIYRGQPLTRKRIQKLRGNEIVMVPQSTSYLDPLMKVGQQICKGSRDEEKKKKLNQIFHRFSLEEKVQQQYPFELSGGMTRRI